MKTAVRASDDMLLGSLSVRGKFCPVVDRLIESETISEL